MGYLPHTMVNFLTLLGWSLDDKTELFTTDSLIENFTIERVSKSGAIFNNDKLDWMNGHYIREMSADELADAYCWTSGLPSRRRRYRRCPRGS